MKTDHATTYVKKQSLNTIIVNFLPAILMFFLWNDSFAQFTSNCGYAGTPITVQSSCVPVTFDSNNNTDYWNSAAGCGAADLDDAWWWFIATSNSTTITYNSVNDAILTLFTGACNTGMASLTCVNATVSGNETITYPTIPGTSYAIRIQRVGSDNNLVGTICVYSAPPDTPCSAWYLSVGSTGTCTMQSFSNSGLTDSGEPNPGCGFYTGGDLWLELTVPASGNVIIDTDAGTLNGMAMSVYSGTCAALTLIECDVADSGNDPTMPMVALSGQVPGSTLWIRLWDRYGDQTGTFSVCATDNVVPANDEPCNATALATGATCTLSTHTLQYATNSMQSVGVAASTCITSQTITQDVWFTATIPASGYLDIQTDNLAVTNSMMELYSGPNCNTLTSIGCYDDGGQLGASMADGYAIGAPGTIIWIRVWEKWGDITGTFAICAKSNTLPCGGTDPLLLNDFCQNPASLTWNPPASFAASTAASFTPDVPGNYDVTNFTCGTIQNNSWYTFTAGQNGLGDGIDTFAITTIANCANATNGIQAHVYEILTDANGCCTAFTNMSNCLGNQTTVPAYVIATGLIPGNNYVLMIDGYAGNNCDFIISGWGATGILPVGLVELSGIALPDRNVVSWKTSSEQNNDYFKVFRSTTGDEFELIGIVDGSGTSNSLKNYSYAELNPRTGINYYYIEQVDFNGSSVKSEVIAIETKVSGKGMVNLYPNPTRDKLTIELFIPGNTIGSKVQLMSPSGVILEERDIHSVGIVYELFDLSGLSKGMYFINYSDSERFSLEKITKY